MKKLPKGHVWLCEPCGVSVSSEIYGLVTSFMCDHTEAERARAEVERLWPQIEKKLNEIYRLRCKKCGKMKVIEHLNG